MATRGRPGGFPVVFDEAAWAQDMRRYPPGSGGRQVAEAARRQFEQHGVPRAALLACDEEGPDRTRLAGHAKVYLPLIDRPPEERPFGMVFAVDRRDDETVLAYAAFGVRHRPRGAQTRTVCERAHWRLHGRWP